MPQQQSFLDKCYRDKEGTIVLFQAPNAPLLVWLVCTLLSNVIKSGVIHTVLVIVATFALIIWALLEILFGVTYLRRLLGLLVLVATIAPRIVN